MAYRRIMRRLDRKRTQMKYEQVFDPDDRVRNARIDRYSKWIEWGRAFCCHCFVDDVIDITLDQSQNITYCTVCEISK